MVDAATFRASFPEFADPTKYPDAQINFWIGISPVYLNPCVYTDPAALDFVTQLFVAHNIVLSRTAQFTSQVGGIPGGVTGPTTSKQVDKVSYSSAAQLVALENGGAWNMTQYGIQFLQLARMWGAGGFQLMPSGDALRY